MSNFHCLDNCVTDFITERLDAARIDQKTRYLYNKVKPVNEEQDAVVLDYANETQRLSYLAGLQDGFRFAAMEVV
jgi:hypothetical protein